MTGKNIPVTPEAKFAAEVERLVTTALRKQRFIIPQFAADPPETDPTNLWMRYDGRLRGRYWNGSAYVYIDYPLRTDITSPPAVPAYPARPAYALAPETKSKTWDALWSQTYTGAGAKRTDTIGEVNMAFGRDPDGVYGLQRALCGFDYADMVSTLTGSTIQKVELTMTVLSAYYPTAVEVFYGMHNQTAEPTTYDATTTLLRYGDSDVWQPGQDSTFTLPVSFAGLLRAGTAKGLVLDPPTNDKAFFGIVAGVGSGYTPPQLTVTYAK